MSTNSSFLIKGSFQKRIDAESVKQVYRDSCTKFKIEDFVDNIELHPGSTSEALPSSFTLSSVSRIHGEVASRIAGLQGVLSAGFFPNGTHYYFICDDGVHIFNTATGHHHVLSDRNVKAAGFIKSNPEVFGVDVDFMIILGSQDGVTTYGVKIFDDETISFHVTDYSAQYRGLEPTEIQTTNNQRVFIGNKGGNIYEFRYQAQATFFSPKCTIVNCTVSYLFFIPFLPSDKGEITQLLVDNSRNVLYSLSSKSVLSIIGLGSAGNEFNFIGEVNGYQSQAKAFLGIFSRPSALEIARIEVIPASESKQLRLLAITFSGASLFFKSSKSNCANQASGLQLYHAKAPYNQSPHFETLIRPTTIFSNGLLIISSLASVDNSTISISYSETLPHFDKSKPYKLHTSLTLEGSVYAMLEIPCHETQTFAPSASLPYLSQSDDLKSQYYFAPRQFLVLSSIGVYTMTKQRPMDMLFKIFSLSESIGDSFNSFLNFYGPTAVCSMLIAFLSQHPTALLCIKNDLNVNDLILRCQIDDSILRNMKDMLNEIKGLPRTLPHPSSNIFLYDVASCDHIELDSQIAGLLQLIAYVLHPIASLKMFSQESSGNGYKFNISCSNLKQIRLLLTRILFTLSDLDVNFQFSKVQLESDKSLKAAISAQGLFLPAIGGFLSLCIEVLSLLQLLTKYDLPGAVQLSEKSVGCTFAGLSFDQLVNPVSGPALIRDFVNFCIEYQNKYSSKERPLIDEVKATCPNLFDSDSLFMMEGIDKLSRSQVEFLTYERTLLLKQSHAAFSKIDSVISEKYLTNIVDSYIPLGFQTGAWFLVADQIKKDNNSQQYTQTLVKLFHQILASMLPILKENFKNGSAHKTYTNFAKSLAQVLETCKNHELNKIVFRLLIENDLMDLLIHLSPARLDLSFLSNSKPEDLLTLIKYQLYRNQYYMAGQSYRKLAGASSPTPISTRLHYLKLSLPCFEKQSGTVSQIDEEVTPSMAKNYIELAQIQKYIADQGENFGLNQTKVNLLKNHLLSKEQLLSEMNNCENLSLVPLFNASLYTNPNEGLIQSAWKLYFERALEQSVINGISFKDKVKLDLDDIQNLIFDFKKIIPENFIAKLLLDMSLNPSQITLNDIPEIIFKSGIPYFLLIKHLTSIFFNPEINPGPNLELNNDMLETRANLFDKIEILVKHPVFKELSADDRKLTLNSVKDLIRFFPDLRERTLHLIESA